MADPKGFLHTPRETPSRRPVDVRIQDWREVYADFDRAKLERQAGRCMDCGIPFCHTGCPLGNLIPEWNDLVWRHDWFEAAERLHATNNFPEFTGRLCPAPCETACVLGINADPVTIKQVEVEIASRAWHEGWVQPRPAAALTGYRVAVVGSGPAGLAAAQQLTRAGHEVTVYERADRPGGLLRYGIPEFKMEKRHLDRRLGQMRAEGTRFRCGVTAGVDISADELRRTHDAIVLAGGATAARELQVPGCDLDGIHQAMEYLPLANRVTEGDLAESAITAEGKNVVIIGGGDTGADCLGTALRQRAASVVQLEIMPRPPAARPDHQPWPTYPMIYRVSSAHEEGGGRVYSVSTQEFIGGAAVGAPDGRGTVGALDGGGVQGGPESRSLGRAQGGSLGRAQGRSGVRALRMVDVELAGGRFQPVPGTERDLPCELVLLAMGFTGPERSPLLADLGVAFDHRGNVARDESYATSVPGVFVAGDMGRGQSLIVWAIAEGRSAAAAADRFLRGDTTLPAPIPATARPLS